MAFLNATLATKQRIIPALLSLTAAFADARPLQPLDVFELEFVAEAQIAQAGDRIVYERRSFDIMTDRTSSSLWTVAPDGSSHEPLLASGENARMPRISPDGTRLAYVASDGTHKQIHMLWLTSGRTAVLSKLQQEPDNLTWSPDGHRLAFTMEVPAEREPFAKAPKAPEGAEWAPPVKVIDSVLYRYDGRGFLEPAYSHIFTLQATGGTATQHTTGAFNHGGPLSWTPDSRHIVFSANRDPDWAYDRVGRDLFRLRLADDQVEQLTSGAIASSPAVAPDGRRIAFLRAEKVNDPYRPNRLYLRKGDGSEQPLTADLDRSVRSVHWAGDGSGLYFTYDDRGKRVLAFVNLQGERTVLTDAVGGTSLGRPYTGGQASLAANGTAAFPQGSAQRPADLGVITADGRRRTLTNLNDDALGRVELGTLRELSWTSPVGDVPVHGWYLLPPGYDPHQRYPLILELHGGPHLSYGPTFSAEMQLMAAAGYVVFYDNYRGSSSYGNAFAQLLKYRYSSPDEFADHMAGIDKLIAGGIADPEQLFITGGSAGGIATLYAIGLTDRFRAAAAAKPIANWLSKTLTGDSYTYQIPYQFPDAPWNAVQHYWQRSPLSLMGNVTTPTLLLTGEQDYRTPISETEQYYQALKYKRVDTMMVRVPDASHSIAARPSRLLAKVAHILAWFERYRPASEVTAESETAFR